MRLELTCEGLLVYLAKPYHHSNLCYQLDLHPGFEKFDNFLPGVVPARFYRCISNPLNCLRGLIVESTVKSVAQHLGAATPLRRATEQEPLVCLDLFV